LFQEPFGGQGRKTVKNGQKSRGYPHSNGHNIFTLCIKTVRFGLLDVEMVRVHCGVGANLSPRAVSELGVPHMQKWPIFRLWGPPLTPLWGATQILLLILCLQTRLRVPTKFGEDPTVNKALPQWGYPVCVVVLKAPKVRKIILMPAKLAYRAIARPGAHRRREELAAGVAVHETFSLSRSSITRRGNTHEFPRRRMHTHSVYSANSAGWRRRLMHQQRCTRTPYTSIA
jgi:hypothetical protein